MRFNQSRHKVRMGELDLIPFVNVFFVLLIFFMFSSSFIFQPGMNVSLPKAVTAEVVSQENVVLVVTQDNVIYLNDRQINEEELASSIRLLAKDKRSLLIKADSGSSLGKIVQILDICRLEGLSQVSLAASKEA